MPARMVQDFRSTSLKVQWERARLVSVLEARKTEKMVVRGLWGVGVGARGQDYGGVGWGFFAVFEAAEEGIVAAVCHGVVDCLELEVKRWVW
jgi:hypothetical protein